MKKVILKLLLIILIFFVSLIALEYSFRGYLSLTGKADLSLMKFDEFLEKSWFIPHPYLVYVFKPDNSFEMEGKTFTINSFGFRSTLEYDVHSKKKPANTLRVMTFGGSTTGGVNFDNEIWPYQIGKNLSRHFPNKQIEVLNEGTMGYTSLDNLVDLSIRAIDFESDVYIIYLGVNDYTAIAPPDIYRSDYSHFRKTLWENLSFSIIEIMPPWLLRSRVVTAALIRAGVKDRRNLLANTGTMIFRQKYLDELKMQKRTMTNKKYKAMLDSTAVRIRKDILRNVKSMVGIIKSHNPQAVIMLSSFYHSAKPHYIKELNAEFESFASSADIVFVDAAAKMPDKKGMVYDYGHFTVEGDKQMGRIFSDAIIEVLE